MRFALTEEQRLLRSSVADVLAKTCTVADVRAAFSGERAISRERWATLGELGVLGMLVPEASGGLGLGELELVLVLEETGKVCLPEPVVETAAIVAPLLAEAGDAKLAARWLPRIARGEAVATIAFGNSDLLTAGPEADLAIVQRGEHLYALERGAVAVRAERSVDGTRRIGTLSWDDALPDDARVALEVSPIELMDRARLRGALGTAAELLGLGRAMLDRTVEYVCVRQQFGKPIGSQQAVKHMLASALVALEMARPSVLYAAYELARGAPGADVRVFAAKALASDAATTVARAALQCHGAIGYSFEHDLHLFLKRTWALAAAYGTAEHCRQLVLDGLVARETPPE